MVRRLRNWSIVLVLLFVAAFVSMIRVVPSSTFSAAPALVSAPRTVDTTPAVTTVPAGESTEAAPALATVPAGQSTDATPLIIPVQGVRPNQLVDTWGQSRASGAREHHAIDIMAARGTPVLAAASGAVEKIFESVPGGHTIYVRTADGRTIHYYAHLDAYAPGLHEHQQVSQGEMIATVGSTGDASPNAPHLHFEIKTMQPGEHWWQGTDINPYPLLAGIATVASPAARP